MRTKHTSFLITVISFFIATSCIAIAQNSRNIPDYYVQLASFIKKANATHFKKSVQSKTHYPVKISHIQKYYVVKVGPIYSASAAREIRQSLTPPQKVRLLETQNHAVNQQYEQTIPHQSDIPTLFHHLFSQGNLFVAAYGGIQQTIVDNHYTQDNGSGYTFPSNLDYYSTDINPIANVAVEAGYRWVRDTQYIPAYAFSLRYEHSFANNVGDKITQYSMSEFTNYTYNWDVSSDVFLLLGKMNLVNWHHLSPYIMGGFGIALNRATGYKETALPNVTPRTSPGFPSNTRSKLAYNLGVGVDWQLYPQLIMSLDYEYQDLGKVSSRSGYDSWSGNKLYSGNYQTNTVMLGLSYLFDS